MEALLLVFGIMIYAVVSFCCALFFVVNFILGVISLMEIPAIKKTEREEALNGA